MTPESGAIADLTRLVMALPSTAREVVERLYEIVDTVGSLDQPSEEMRELFTSIGLGSIERVCTQRIVRVTNRHTHESALFNELRASRPMEMRSGSVDETRTKIEESAGESCDFCNRETRTPVDSFIDGGRVRGEHAVTASNVAKYDGFHGVLVFDNHDPLAEINEETLVDYFKTARRWADAAHAHDPEARYYFLLWNSLWRAGGSKIHGHMQMTVTRHSHYGRIEALRATTSAFRAQGRDYFDDLIAAHDSLGLARQVNHAYLLASLTPIKEREIILVAPPGEDERALAQAIACALTAYRRHGVLSWNLALFVPPLADDGADWTAFRTHARLVDRGDPINRTSDIGTMELYGASVVSTDPFALVAELDADIAG
jgi:hypothetical protein